MSRNTFNSEFAKQLSNDSWKKSLERAMDQIQIAAEEGYYSIRLTLTHDHEKNVHKELEQLGFEISQGSFKGRYYVSWSK